MRAKIRRSTALLVPLDVYDKLMSEAVTIQFIFEQECLVAVFNLFNKQPFFYCR